MKLHAGISTQELFYLSGLVCRQIIESDVNLLIRFTARDNLFEEVDELGAGVPLSGPALYLPRFHIQCSIQ